MVHLAIFDNVFLEIGSLLRENEYEATLCFRPRARIREKNVVVYGSQYILCGESGTLLQGYDLAGASVDKRIKVDKCITYHYVFTFAVERWDLKKEELL